MVGQERLSSKLSGVINRIPQDLDDIGESVHVLDLNNDGLAGVQCCAARSGVSTGALIGNAELISAACMTG